jgi:hypothetical protein
MRCAFLLSLFVNVVLALPSAFPRDRPADAMFAAAKTGKERLGDKASDEQRVNDCKVPEARRTRARPADCAEYKGS